MIILKFLNYKINKKNKYFINFISNIYKKIVLIIIFIKDLLMGNS